jgi:hypothetical protein
MLGVRNRNIYRLHALRFVCVLCRLLCKLSFSMLVMMKAFDWVTINSFLKKLLYPVYGSYELLCLLALNT